jgi:hypothetical protein
MKSHAKTLAELERQEKVLAESGIGGLKSIQILGGRRFGKTEDAALVQAIHREADRLAVARKGIEDHAHEPAADIPDPWEDHNGVAHDDVSRWCVHPRCLELWPCAPYRDAYRLTWGAES